MASMNSDQPIGLAARDTDAVAGDLQWYSLSDD
jgi:hypothetical protein